MGEAKADTERTAGRRRNLFTTNVLLKRRASCEGNDTPCFRTKIERKDGPSKNKSRVIVDPAQCLPVSKRRWQLFSGGRGRNRGRGRGPNDDRARSGRGRRSNTPRRIVLPHNAVQPRRRRHRVGESNTRHATCNGFRPGTSNRPPKSNLVPGFVAGRV